MNDLTTGKEGRLILFFALPMLLGNVFQQVYNIVDSIIVGNFLGKEALSAVGASFPIIFVLISLIIGIASGTSIIISQNFGAKDIEKVRRAIDTIYIFLFFSYFIVAGLGILFSESIFRLISLPETIIPQAKIYFHITMYGLITDFGFNATSSILRGLGDSKTPLYFLIFSTILNIILDLLFVIVFEWGIAGVAIASVISKALALLAAIWYLNKHHEIIRISLKKMTFDKTIFVQSLKIGLPSGLQHMFVALGMMALFKIVNIFGTDVIAAYSVAMRIDAFAVMPAMNFSMALTAFVGQNLGAKKLYRVKKGMLATFFMTALISVTFTLTALFLGEEIMRVFTPDENVIKIGAEYLLIVGFFYISFSTMFTINSVFRGAGDTIVPMFITLFSLWIIRIPISYFLSQEIGVKGIWWGIPIAWIIGMCFSFFYYLTGRWKTKTVV